MTGAALKHRIEMVRKSNSGCPLFPASDLHECKRFRAFLHLSDHAGIQSRCYPEHEFYFILGADSLFSIEQWKYFREIFPTCTILAAMRDDKDAKEMQRQIQYLTDKYNARIRLLRAPLLEISSTVIRERASRNLGVRYMVPDSVAGVH